MRKLVTIQSIHSIQDIERSENLALATICGWKTIVQKKEFKPGDLCVYFEIDSYLPERPEFEFLRKTSFKKMGEKQGFRLKTMKMWGEISQGLALPISILENYDGPLSIGTDVTSFLGVEKYEPEIANTNSDILGAFPGCIPKTDEIRLQSCPEIITNYIGCEFSRTEKLDGSSTTVYLLNNHFGICSRNFELKLSKSPVWKVADELQLEKKLKQVKYNVALQGELIGPGIQKNMYQLTKHHLYFFNAFNIDTQQHLSSEEFVNLMQELDLPTVPILSPHKIIESMDEMMLLAEGKSILNDNTEREGVVWRFITEQNERISFKTISNKYLLKTGN